MPFAVIPDEAEINIINGFVLTYGPWTIRLYTNNLTPVQTTVLADFTEASFPGYAPINWTPYSFVTDVNHKASAVPATPSFTGPTSGGSVNVYGFFVKAVNYTTPLVMCGRFVGAPIVLATTADVLAFILNFRAFDFHQ